VPWSLDTCATPLSPVQPVGMHGFSNRDIHLCSPHNNSLVQLTITTEMWPSGRITNGMRSGWRTLRDSVLSSPTSAPILLEWPCQEQPGSGLTDSAPLLDFSDPAYTNGIWPLLRLVSVAQRNTLLAMLSFTVQSIDLHMDSTAWWFLVMRQSNGCSTLAMRSCAA